MTLCDYVVVGGGCAGLIVSNRLSADPAVRILVLEAGREHRSPLLTIPAGEVLLLGDPRYDWRFETEPDPTLEGRRVRIPRGRLLGGSTAINGMIYVRGQAADFDGWAAAGAPGWSYDEVLPYFRRLEDWAGGSGNAARGLAGPIRVELPRQREILCDVFIEAASQLRIARNDDYNAGPQDGVGLYQCTQRAGRRWSVLDGYLAPARRRPNLEIVTGAQVVSLVLEGRRCVGVRYRQGGVLREARAEREIVLSAGVIQSPHLLELSGIGAPALLARAGIPVRHALPGVGENFHDHFATRLRWRVRQRVTFNERTRGLALAREVSRYALGRRGVLSLPIALGFGFVRSGPQEVSPDVQLHFAPASYGPGSTRRLDALPGMTIGVYPLRPESRGTVHLRSADPLEAPAIAPRFLEAEADRLRLVAGMRIARRIVAQAPFDPYRGEELLPGAACASDDDLVAYARLQGDTSFHPVGTCRMGNDPLAVVDHRLRVRGLEGLRVVDASIMPTMVSGNTQAATMMIAEKGAAMIREDAARRPAAEARPRLVAAS